MCGEGNDMDLSVIPETPEHEMVSSSQEKLVEASLAAGHVEASQDDLPVHVEGAETATQASSLANESATQAPLLPSGTVFPCPPSNLVEETAPVVSPAVGEAAPKAQLFHLSTGEPVYLVGLIPPVTEGATETAPSEEVGTCPEEESAHCVSTAREVIAW